MKSSSFLNVYKNDLIRRLNYYIIIISTVF